MVVYMPFHILSLAYKLNDLSPFHGLQMEDATHYDSEHLFYYLALFNLFQKMTVQRSVWPL